VAEPAKLKRTPFYDYHVKFGGKMVDFAGWEMPLLYKEQGIIAEHEHTRRKASIFDVSHMGRVKFTGKDATAFLSRLVTRNIEKGAVGQSMYSLVCNERGGVLDDVIVSRFDDHWLMVCNASNREKLLAWFEKQKGTARVKIDDQTMDTSMVAVQGPKVLAMLNALLPDPIDDLKRYHFVVQRYMMMISFTVFRSGYTGEDGVEIIFSNTVASLAINFLLKGNDDTSWLKPAGLGARDTLRLEAGMPLYGHELSEDGDPLSAGLGWAVDLNKEFIGAAALREIAKAGPKQRIVGLFIDGPRAARQGMAVLADGRPVGTVTSGATSPTLKRCIAMAYVDIEHAMPDTKLTVDLRGTQVDATVSPLPFYKRGK
jgi:aminomethyltransferase